MLPVWTLPPLLPYEPEILDPDIVSVFAGSGVEQRASILSRPLMRWPLVFQFTLSERNTARAFWLARRGRVQPFYWRDLLDYQRTGIALTPASDGATLEFALPASGEFGGDYPISDANVRLYRDGVLNGGTLSATTDYRRLITDAAPALPAKPMTGDYWYFRRVRFAEPLWRETYLSGSGVFRVSLGFQEAVG